MSRSYRKHSYWKDSQRTNLPHRLYSKTIANRMVRRTSDVPNNSSFKKVYDSWDICDYAIKMTENELREQWENGDEWLHRRFRNYKQAYRWWYTTYKGK